MPEGVGYGRRRITPEHTALLRQFMSGRRRRGPTRSPEVSSPTAYAQTPAGQAALRSLSTRSPQRR
jgi:hypothetical protein